MSFEPPVADYCSARQKFIAICPWVLYRADVLASFENGTFAANASTNFWLVRLLVRLSLVSGITHVHRKSTPGQYPHVEQVLAPNYTFVQQRSLAENESVATNASVVSVIANATRHAFAQGHMAVTLDDAGTHRPPMIWTTYRRNQVNHYEVSQNRLTCESRSWQS